MSEKIAKTLLMVVCLAGFAAAAASAATTPQGGGANNVVIAQSSTDGSWVARANTQVSQSGSNAITSSNIATATDTDCIGCDSTAVAVQVVFVSGSPQYFTPANFASAANGGCTGCGAFAYAWQYVVQTDGPVLLTSAGRDEVSALRQQIAETAASLEPDTLENDLALQTELDALTGELKSVIDSQTQLAGVHAYGAVLKQVDTHPSAVSG